MSNKKQLENILMINMIKEELISKNIYNIQVNKILTNTLSKTEKEYINLKNKLKTNTESLKSKHNYYISTIEYLQSVNDALSRDVKNLTILYREIESKINEIIARNMNEVNILNDDISKNEEAIKTEINQLETKLSSLSNDLSEMNFLEEEYLKYKDLLYKNKHEKLTIMADKEKEKVIETIKLKQEMDDKIKEAEILLINLKKDEIETTTRLTFLQNHQLNNELEYQSKQIEMLLKENNKLEYENNMIKKDIFIHKEVEIKLSEKSQSLQNSIKIMADNIKKIETDVINISKKEVDIKKIYDNTITNDNTDYNNTITNLTNKINNYIKKNEILSNKITKTKKLHNNVYSNDNIILNNIIDKIDINNYNLNNNKEEIINDLMKHFHNLIKNNKSEIQKLDIGNVTKNNKKNTYNNNSKLNLIEIKNILTNNDDDNCVSTNIKANIVKMSLDELRKMGINNIKKILNK